MVSVITLGSSSSSLPHLALAMFFILSGINFRNDFISCCLGHSILWPALDVLWVSLLLFGFLIYLRFVYFYSMCLGVWPACLCTTPCSTRRGQKRVADPQEPPRAGSWAWVLWILASALDHWLISAALEICFSHRFYMPWEPKICV